MPKITKQNVGGVGYTMVGCALNGVCASSADSYIKVVTLTDGDAVSDGMSLLVIFGNANTAGTAPDSITLYSSDQIHYYTDAELTQAYTLAPEGCYTIEYTGSGNAYTYISYPVIQVGDVAAPICTLNGKYASTGLWDAGDSFLFIYAGGKFLGMQKPITSAAILDMVHPVGSLYWTSSSEDPAITFGGGTWTQIKDVFVWAKGDSDTVNATGGAKTVTLTTGQIPSHTHTFTGSAVTSGGSSAADTGSTQPSFTGSAVTSGGSSAADTGSTQPSFTGTAVTSGANSRGHTHSVTASGSVSVTTNPTFTGSSVNTSSSLTYISIQNKAMKGTITKAFASSAVVTNVDGSMLSKGSATESYSMSGSSGSNGLLTIDAGHTHSYTDPMHSHSVTANGTISGGAYKFTGSAVTSGGESQDHTHSVTASGTVASHKHSMAHTHSVTASGTVASHSHTMAHTHSVTASGSNSNTGGGQAHSNMPPYVVKYCWERTA